MADDILNRVDSLQSLFGPSPSHEEGLNIAVSYGFLGRIPERAESFIFGFEQRISLFEMGCEDCYRAVLSGEEDIGLILCMKRDFPDCNSDEVGRLKAYAIVNESSPLAQKRQLSVFDLKTQKLQIMSDSAFQHEPLFSELNSLGYDFSDISVAASASALYGIKRNEAIGIATSKFADSVPEGMRAIPLDDPRYDWRIYALHSRQPKHWMAIARFIQGFRKSYSSS
ncbi:LysR family transcriptional regulator substrate-binding protein [Raoultibacter phocaeensis]|uniref:LysR family transcriptional regulator substrate-binding protein n=1 Tax=Raoultibacter phocaeensis TaxID=2479841 RepID=UPI00210672FB|nr:LysR family transcriptional regulator substrate-binding protein [Raoultibacter phocaeensis]